jgi:DNA-binding response OmpR family regulator
MTSSPGWLRSRVRRVSRSRPPARKEAREYLARESVDITVVDLALPDGEGTELLQESRTRRAPT